MSKIKFSGLGWEGYTGQIVRIKEGFESLGHATTHDNPDLIFCNDPGQYINGINLKKKFPNSFLIFNFLDVPWHFPGVMKKLEIEKNEVYLIQRDNQFTEICSIETELAFMGGSYVIDTPYTLPALSENEEENDN